MKLPTLDSIKPAGKTVLVRADLNVPMEGGRVTDATRIARTLPTLKELLKAKARVVVMSHFGRPEGKFVPSMSLGPLVDTLSELLEADVRFGVDCVGPAAREAVGRLKEGELLLLENLRFHAEEEKNDPSFSRDLAALGDIYVNDAFSCSHRAHASVVGITHHLPSVAGRLLQTEVETLEHMFSEAERPLAVVVGGSKVSTKLELLENLVGKADVVAIGGAMANTFLMAKGHTVGRSICEKNMVPNAKKILQAAEKSGCRILLPTDLILVEAFGQYAPCKVMPVDNIHESHMAADIGPASVEYFAAELRKCRTIVWNGPVGAFETTPFGVSTFNLARILAAHTRESKAKTLVGGGDTVAAIAQSGLTDEFTYVSTAGGAFLEWLEGKTLPGISALLAGADAKTAAHAAS